MEEKTMKAKRPRRSVKDEKGTDRYMKEQRRIVNFDMILETIMDFPIKRVAVAVAQDRSVLEAVFEAQEREVIGSMTIPAIS